MYYKEYEITNVIIILTLSDYWVEKSLLLCYLSRSCHNRVEDRPTVLTISLPYLAVLAECTIFVREEYTGFVNGL